jgi:FAD/FMN-containing dehydrogenase
MTVSTDGTIAAFAGRLKGSVLLRDDASFEASTHLWNGMITKSPALVVQAADTTDVAGAIDLAHDLGLPVSVKGGGHNISGTALADGGVAIDMARLRRIVVDPEARTAVVQPGCLLREVDSATQAHGLAVPLGFISEVGVAGLTLGGGLGYLTRRFGWTVDNLLEVELVTADGAVRRASRHENPDLFWAVRGAGANLGAVTSFTFRLHEVGPIVVGGLVAWPFTRSDEILSAYRTITAAAPRELAVWMLLFRAPPAPFVPAEWHGKQLCGMAVCYSGAPDAADDALAPIRDLGDPVLDLIQPQPYTQLQSYLDATEPKGNHYYWRTEYLSELDDQLLESVRDVFARCPVPGGDVGLLHIEGALNERSEDDGAVGNRDARYVVGVKGMWGPDESEADAFRGWVRDGGDRIRPFSTGRTYINFQTADEGEERIHATYGDNYDRLLEVKRRYDPDNVFRSNRNIVPR